MLGSLLALAAILAPADPAANQPVEPFRIAGNLYYVGTNEIASYLLTSPAGHVLIDTAFVESAPQILANIGKLGFRPADVKILLNTQAHFDHAGGFAELKRVSGASLQVMEGDAEQIAAGGLHDFAFGDKYPFPAVKPDKVLHDGAVIALGD